MSNPISCYDPTRFDSVSHGGWTKAQSQAGGRKRAQTARRDKWGRMLPNDSNFLLPNPKDHGKAGGLARSRQAKRFKGRYIKNEESLY